MTAPDPLAGFGDSRRPWIARWRDSESPDGYSLKQYDELRCIFVRIPKTASRSVALGLFGTLGGGHSGVRQYRQVFGAAFDEYFKFTFVRNPWDRLVSAYFFVTGGGLTEEARAWSHTHLAGIPTFEAFVQRWLSREHAETWRHFRPQHSYVCDADGRLAVDFVGCFERLEQDVRTVSRTLGVETTLRHENPTPTRRPDYRTYYTDAMAESVGAVYRRDIELFHYRFDQPSPDA